MYFLLILGFMIPALVIILLLIAAFSFARRRFGSGQRKSDSFLVFSKEDFVSQAFYLLALLYFAIILISFKADLGLPLTLPSILLICVLAGFAMSYSFKTFFTFIGSSIGLYIWVAYQGVLWAEKYGFRVMALLASLLLLSMAYYLVGRLHAFDERYARFASVLKVFGLIYISSLLFFFSNRFALSAAEELTQGSEPFWASWQMSLLLAALSLLVLLAGGFAFAKKRISKAAAIALPALFVLAVFLAFVRDLDLHSGFYHGSFTDNLMPEGVLWLIAFNLMIFFEFLLFIVMGYMQNDTGLINLGTFSMFCLVFVKYFDWMSTFQSKSFMFISAGIFMFALGWAMQKFRKRLIRDIENKTHYDPIV